MKTRYFILCAISGCVWGAIVWFLGHRGMGSSIWGGILASPFIGVIVGATYRPAYRLHVGAQLFTALFSLYFAAVLFGFAMGLYDEAVGRSISVPYSGVLEGIHGTLWGLTFSGYVLFLWPLSYLNHLILSPIAKVEPVSPKIEADSQD